MNPPTCRRCKRPHDLHCPSCRVCDPGTTCSPYCVADPVEVARIAERIDEWVDAQARKPIKR